MMGIKQRLGSRYGRVGGWRDRPPGFGVVAMTTMAAALLLCVRYDWWPPMSNLDNEAKFLMIAASASILFVAGSCWLIRTAFFVRRRRRGSWFILAAPTILAVYSILRLVPGPSTFDDERPAFDKLVRQVIENPGSVDDVELGTFDIDAAQRQPDGAIYFYDADASFGRTTGWVYSPNGTPTYYEAMSLKELGGGWYRFRAST